MAEVAESYLDVWGRPKPIDPQVRAALMAALEGVRLSSKKISIERAKCFQPPLLEEGGRLWGFTVQLYGLRSQRNWGIGDFGDLRRLAELSGRMGAGILGVNPLHATSGTSPYSPSSRHALNVLYIDVDALPEFGAVRHRLDKKFWKGIERLKAAPLVDYDGVRAAKLQALELAYRALRDRKGLAAFARSASRELRDFAIFEALREKFGGGWPGWPEPYRSPSSSAVRAFEKKNRKRVDFHLWLQWRARQQLDAAQAACQAAGMPVGLYVDLALGADGGGAETWSDQAAFAPGVSIGAPPDEFNPKGQDWGLPPYSPRALAAQAYEPFANLLRANMPRGGALRMDHVMSLMRLWWIPHGNKPEQGGYVHYPFEDLLGILARESRARRCLVVGEDLGTVLPEFRHALNQAGVLSYRPLLFEKLPDGRFSPPEAYPREALVCVTTHDLPTWKGFFEGGDLSLRRDLGLSVDPEKECQSREQDQKGLQEALKGEDPHAFLARTPAKLLVVQPEDVLGLEEQANLPGTVAEHPNWRRKLPLPLEQWRGDERMAALVRSMAGRGGRTRVPRATYRFQFHKGFRFADATRLVPYLAKLGVSHVYASPFLKARPGSTHGYDIVDHNQINPEIGTRGELDALVAELVRHRMGLVMDIVPNHMGVLHGDNAWWQDVLARGRASPYARYFDIDWLPAKRELWGKVLLGILGKHYGQALEDGDIKLEKNGVRYFDHLFPLNRALKGKTKGALALHRLLEKQHYRLAYWRVAGDEINYRRFFEIVDLAALRQEDPAVFEATHGLVAELAHRPGVDGLRVDHPDGLADPRTYFRRLQEKCGHPWLVVEKIVADHESLPEDWPVDGTTGYRFANLLTGLFVDGNSERLFDRIYQRFTGDRRPFEQISYESRMLIMNTTLSADLHRLATRLARIASGNRFTRDYTASGLRLALREVAARFPVYRTYVTAAGASEADRKHIDWAIGKAKRASHTADPSVFDFIRSVLLLEISPERKERQNEILDFALRFQQFTAPVVAKGVEDTAFYRYHRLVALNEVGGEPARFGTSLKAFHAASEDRAKHWPRTMIATSTHDTKRSEDVRARLVVLSELASGWRLTLRRWNLLTRSTPAPHPKDEYLFYQVLIGIWPAASPDEKQIEELKKRLSAYMLKAVREAKERTSWVNPDAEYEAALQAFVAGALSNKVFLKDVEEVVARVARLGLLVGLSQAVLKIASPGVPDYYQGTELWDYSLVDPDNRRPVDYRKRMAWIGESSSPEDLVKDLSAGKAKMHVIRQGLKLRCERPELFLEPSYTALYADAGSEERVCSFMLQNRGRSVIAVAPRLFAHLLKDGEAMIPAAAWGEARLPVPPGCYEDVLTGKRYEIAGEGIHVAQLLDRFPVALLKNL
ncbi:MAG: malto-oligosyltrehalose synthase [Clostridia bacterium]